MSTTIQPSANMDLDTSTQAENNSNTNNNTNALSINASVIQVGGGSSSSSIVANGICACDATQSQQACPILITSAQQQLQADEQSEHHEQQQQQQEQQQQSYQLQDIPATDSGRASVNEFDTTTTMLEDTLPATIVALTTTSDTGNEANVASFKDDVAAIPATIVTVGAGNTQDFYASSGSQTKWYLRPTEICGADVSCSVVPSPPTPPCVAVNNVVIISTSGSTEVDEFVSQATTVGGIVKCTAGVEGSPRAKNPIALPTVNDVKSSYSTNLTHQMRAVSSPSLTDALQEELNYAAVGAAATTVVLHTRTTDSSGASGESTPTMVTATANNQSNSVSSNSNNNSGRPLGSLPSSQSVGVLQKFKRTLTNFNKPAQQQQPQQITSSNSTSALVMTNSTSTTNATSTAGGVGGINAINASENQSDAATTNSALEATAGKYRFGPLIWRSSKERRKTKYNRRDKCNSGDSGIQIELDNDEQYSRIMLPASGCGGGVSAGSSNATSASAQRIANEKVTQKMRTVRRANSAKATSITDQSATTALNAKAKILKRMEMYGGSMEREAPESLPARSLSQPNGLDTCGIGRTGDMDDSDSDSVTSHEEAPNYYPIYAEVLYSFTAAGPQELGLERGTLIEVLRKEVGPWWFGRIRKDDNNTLVEEILDPELGWFPKEFVRVIQSPKTDVFFLSQMTTNTSALQQEAPTTKRSSFRKFTKSNTTAITTATATADSNPTTTPTQTSTVTMTASPTAATTVACDLDATMVDENNVTTIVIESPSYASLNNAPSNDSNHSPLSGVGGVAADATTPSNALAPSRSINVILDSADMLRRSAVKELLDTEVNYVKLLAAICEGYLPAMSKRIDIFSPNSIRLIFSNITAIYKFQRKFLEALRKGIEQNQVAKVFLKMHKGFLCYSTYCNAYPRALIELETYDRIKDARTILDNCRESENLAELPLSAHLLAPVQRICRYPLHLSEILKGATKCGEMPEHELGEYEQIDVSQLDIPDTYEKIDLALEAMRGITEAVNEGKRHSETIARHQASFQNFKGPPLHLHSTRFFLQSTRRAKSRISGTAAARSSSSTTS